MYSYHLHRSACPSGAMQSQCISGGKERERGRAFVPGACCAIASLRHLLSSLSLERLPPLCPPRSPKKNAAPPPNTHTHLHTQKHFFCSSLDTTPLESDNVAFISPAALLRQAPQQRQIRGTPTLLMVRSLPHSLTHPPSHPPTMPDFGLRRRRCLY